MFRQVVGVVVFLAGMSAAVMGQAVDNKLSVYPHVPALDPSPHYRFRVRELPAGEWMEPFAFVTRCPMPSSNPADWGYYSDYIGGWTHTYCNFEMGTNVPVEVEIRRLDPDTGVQVDIRTAVPHPRRKVRSWRIEDGRVYAIIENPVFFAVDIDGQMDDRPLPRNSPSEQGMIGTNAVHAVTIFANPFLQGKPVLDDPDVFAVEPGTLPPASGDWTTLYFKPGVHQLWEGTWTTNAAYYMEHGKNYYIPGDAVVHGTFRHHDVPVQTTRFFGHGTVTQERITHALYQNPPLEGNDRGLTSAFKLYRGFGSIVEGVTFTDSPDHTIWIGGYHNPDPASVNYVRWVKVITWRANGDGITVHENAYLEDSFMRTQDDGTYAKALGIRRMVYWNDCNSHALRLSMITQMPQNHYDGRALYIEDIDIIYGRSSFAPTYHHTVIGGVSDFPSDNDGSHIVFRNIHYSDPMPLRVLLWWQILGAHQRDMRGVRFENVRSTVPSIYGYDNFISGRDDGLGSMRDFVMDNVVFAGRQVSSTNAFQLDGAVDNMMFENTVPATNAFQNHSGWGKWYVREDWSASVEPADHDHVKHTAHAGALIVDCPAWAGTVEVAHADEAEIRIEYSGRLFVTDTLTLGNPEGGKGALTLIDGEVVLRQADDAALQLVDGRVHMEKNGVLLWAGDRRNAMKTLLDAGRITLGEGRVDLPEAAPYDRVRREILLAGGDASAAARTPAPVSVGLVGERAVFADYDNINPGYTTFWVADSWGSVDGGATSVSQDEQERLWRTHVFTNAGTHTIHVTRHGMLDYLVVGGGGAGAGTTWPDAGGGGGAGGLRTGLSFVPAGMYEVVVGAGGTGATSRGENGEDSSVFGLVSSGGGGGGSAQYGAAHAGGSGGGGGGHWEWHVSQRYGSDGIDGQGNKGGDGGSSMDNTLRSGGGGGGAFAVGKKANGAAGGDGGAGIASRITGDVIVYAGGGGGGTSSAAGAGGAGGFGGGGRGGNAHERGVDGINGTGGGGGGAGLSGGDGGSGGSGLVVVRYQVVGGGLQPLATLHVSSAYGYTEPAQGTHVFNTGDIVEVSVSGSPVENLRPGTQYVSTGWGGTGSVSNGVGARFSFSIDQDSTLSWLWTTNYWVEIRSLR
jgi:hypothetical protein